MAKAHGGPIDIQGVTVAHLTDKYQVTKLETWFDPVEMFRQIAPEGILRKDVAAAAAAAGCPIAGHSKVSDDETPVKDVIMDLEKHHISVDSPPPDAELQPQNDTALSTAGEAGKALVDEGSRLGSEATASEANPVDGDIPRANAE